MGTAPTFRLLLSIALCLLLETSACTRRAPSPTEALETADHAANAGAASARQLSLSGFHALLLEGDAARAKERFEQALAENPSEPYALHGQLLLAERAANPVHKLEAALDLLERAPAHPLACAAARAVLEAAGSAEKTDELILQRVPSALAAGLPGDAAQLGRSALVFIYQQHGKTVSFAKTLAEMGVPVRLTLLGPLSPYEVLSFDEATYPERTGHVPASLAGPFGETRARTLGFPDGRFSLAGEPSQGDGYLVAVDVHVPDEELYVLRTVSSSAHKLYLDGALLFERRSFARPESTVSAAAVRLAPGAHRLLVRLSQGDRQGTLSLAVMRADGNPSVVTFTPATGPAPRWSPPPPEEASPPSVYPDAADFARALEDEAGGYLAAFLAAKDGMSRDRDGAKALAASLQGESPALRSLRAELALHDRTLPAKVARGHATRDLEAALEKDPGDVRARLWQADLALDDGRHTDALALLAEARGAAKPLSYPVPLLEARVALAMGADAKAEELAREALALQPTLCEALSLRYDLARRRDAAQAADELLKELSTCPRALARAAEHERSRGQLERAVEQYQALVAREPADLSSVYALVNLWVALRRFEPALTELQAQRARWPRNAALLKRLADVHEFAGDKDKALALREAALALDGSDLALRRMVERARTGAEPLQPYAVDGREAIAAYEAQPGTEDATSTYVLDAATVRAYPDGSVLDRIHTVQKVLDQAGVQQVAEVDLPAGAYVLKLRTVKADGSVLEPESIEGKDAISLPGVQVGDYVEAEYLLAHGARGPAQPGFTASSFYFQIFRQPDHWATYRVLAPKGAGLKVDAHNMTAPPPKVEGDLEVFFHEVRHSPPYIPEPDGPPNSNEYLPFVQVGAGAEGNEGVVAAYADAFLERGVLTHEVVEFSKKAAEGKTGLSAVRAIYEAVHQKLKGRDGGLSVSAAASLAQDRGSRLWALKASLEAAGLPTRLAAVRTFSADPAPYRFPNEALLSYLCLRVELPEGGSVWLDPVVRFAPFGELPEQAVDREAYLLPEPNRPLIKVRTPPSSGRAGKEVSLSLTLREDGKLTGTGEETYQGFEGAQLAEALESLSPDQRDQALQSALARYFSGAELTQLTLSMERAVGAPVKVRYQFTAPRFARVEGEGRLMMPSVTFPAYLGRRFVQVGSRKTPLFISASEHSRTRATLTLPPGFTVAEVVPELASTSPFGSFLRKEKWSKNQLLIEEEYRLQMARIRPEQYEAFAAFAGEVDLIQARDLVVTAASLKNAR
ncbi:MAG: hypothetical protein ACOZIN_00125 [Myxococcota bacterium]